MSVNLVESIRGLIPGELVNKAGSFLGESESGIGKALSGILPTVLGGLADKTSTTEGAELVARLAAEQHQSGVLNNLAGFFGSNSSSMLNKGAGLISNIFGNKVGGLTSLLAGFSGIKSSSAGSLFNMIAPVALGFLGKHASANQLNAGSIASLLSSQKDNISKAIPAGLNLGSIFGSTGAYAGDVAKSTVASVRHHSAATEEKAGNTLIWILPLLLLALAAAAVWYFMGTGEDKHLKETTAVVTDTTVKVDMPVVTPTVTGKVDSSGNFIYDMGNMVTIDLPNSAGQLTVGENSTENKLYKFLSDPGAAIDTVIGNWFEFTNVRFKTGSSVITDESMPQLKNLVAITQAFPTAQFKVGGYTDNVGTVAANVALSEKRAAAVLAMLKQLGASQASVIDAKGYGPEWPVGDNATAEGRAMNRRVAVNVKAK